ncbi:uncharacterized protein PV07_01000 [Cladophialophora immunda]|uniref:MARVEL domain-containing protein n=1 Tax=Cladophialophora immunda TaxID=569365 RepID=A0A0D2CSQ3_9EURO|nr:uncharacterized protein PV07_01000 [Cladophialophora immunda]KIW34208.1 hypothetical protein PV07_01000 [Cladophialophora immunda]
MALGGALLRFGQTGLRLLEFASSAIILGIYSYFLAVMADKNIFIPRWEKAVEGMSGAAVLYTIFGVLFTLCLGGISFFALLAVILDICFVGCFAAIAYYTRHGANSCKGFVNTPLGVGLSSEAAPGAGDWGYVCSLNTACFAMAVLNIFLFLITAGMQMMLARHHKKEKRYGPSPANNYTKGFGRRPFWKRNRANGTTRDAEMATGTTPTGAYRPSHETGMTGSTMQGGHVPVTSEPKYGQPGYGMQGYSAPATNY